MRLEREGVGKTKKGGENEVFLVPLGEFALFASPGHGIWTVSVSWA